MQGPLPEVYGGLEYLHELVLNNNQMSGDLGDFSEAIPSDSTTQVLQLQHNKFEGSLFFPALKKLAVFRSKLYDTDFDKTQLHVLDVSYNRDLGGTVNAELLEVCHLQHACSFHLHAVACGLGGGQGAP
jgi:hypothetical protein